MPEVFFTIELPDGKTEQCYSPSTIVRAHFHQNDAMLVNEFVERSRVALTEASERVRARYGYACSSAASQLAQIERLSARYAPEGIIRILSI